MTNDDTVALASLIDVAEALRVIQSAALAGDQGAVDWLLGRCSIGMLPDRFYLDYEPTNSRGSAKSLAWREAIYSRDGHRCQDCGAMGSLHAHHIDEWAMYPERRFDLDNGVTLCPECHAQRHPRHANLIRKAHAHG